MARGPRIAAILLGALVALLIYHGTAHAGISRSILPSYDGIRYAEYPNGDKPVVGGTCPSTWTCAVKGTGIEDIDETSSTEFQIVVDSPSDEGNQGYVYKSCGTGDCQIIARMPATYGGHTEAFTGFGIGFTEGTADAAWYAQNWYPYSNSAPRCKWGTPGPDDGNVLGTVDARPVYLALTHVDSTNTLSCWQSDDGSTWTKISDITRNVSEPILAYVFGTSQETGQTSNASVTNIAFATSVTVGGSGPAPEIERDLLVRADFETGALQSNSNVVNGDLTDGFDVKRLIADTTFTIDSITNSSATPTIHVSAGTLPANIRGFQLGTVSSGMTQVSQRLFRCKNRAPPNCDLWQDGDDDAKPYAGSLVADPNGTGGLPSQRTSTVGYGTWSGTVTATTYQESNTSAGCCSSSDVDDALRVIGAGYTPLTNRLGAANSVSPLHGTYMLDSRIYIHRPYDELSGSYHNNQRWGATLPNSALANTDYNEEAYYGVAIYLPSNYDSNTAVNYNNHASQIFVIGENDDFDDELVQLVLTGGPGSVDSWYVGFQLPSGGGTVVNATSLGTASADFGHWTCWVFRVKPHLTLGILEIWKQPSCETDNDANISKVFMRVSLPLCLEADGESCSVKSFRAGLRQYKYSWNQYSTTTASNSIEVLFDDFFICRVIADACTFEDVHANGGTPP